MGIIKKITEFNKNEKSMLRTLNLFLQKIAIIHRIRSEKVLSL
jgi:hypothetical protein